MTLSSRVSLLSGSMGDILFILIVAGILLLLGKGARSRKQFTPPNSTQLPDDFEKYYVPARSLFVNKSERAFFIILSQQLSYDYLLMAKTRLEDVIGVQRTLRDPKLLWSLRGRVKSRHVDFLICARDGKPLMAIELDGSSHGSANAANGDDLKDRIFRAAGLPFMRVSTGDDFEAAATHIISRLP